MEILHNSRCRKSRETLQIINDKGVDVEIVEYLKNTPSTDELREILIKLGMGPEQIIRKGEGLFKENFKGKAFNDNEWIQILADNPVLIERPIVIKGEKAIIGRPPENVLELL